MPPDASEERLAIAAFRYRLIAEALEVSNVAVGAVLAATASSTHTDPRGRPYRCTARTLWRCLCATAEAG